VKFFLVFLTLAAACLLASCGATLSPQYERKMSQLRGIVPIGSDIHRAKRDLEREGFETSNIYYPTKLGKKLWMNVDFGIRGGSMETFLYTAGIEHTSAPISGLVEANPAGKVTAVR